jgi:hypothetical protein
MCGEDGRQLPFRKLEYITLRLIFGSYCTSWGFDDRLLMKFASKPMISLKRLRLVDCDFQLNGSAVVEAFWASGAKELKYNDGTLQWDPEEWRELEELGVSVTDGGMCEDYSFDREWWTYGHEINVMDSEVY